MVVVVLLLVAVALVALVVLRAVDAPVEPLRPATKRCTLTWYESYPTSKEEANDWNGDQWAGYFKGIRGKRDLWWVQNRNIAAVHSAHYPKFANKWLRVTWRNRVIDCKVIDMCSDEDTDNKKACSDNLRWPAKKPTGFLVDLEIHTARRLGFNGMDVASYQVIQPSQVRYLHKTYPPGFMDRYGQRW